MRLRSIISLMIFPLWLSLSWQLTAQGLIFNFSHDKATYLWEDSAWIDNKITSTMRLHLLNHSTATLVQKALFAKGGDRWQKEANTNLLLAFNQEKRLSWGVAANNDYSRLEDRRVLTNRIGLSPSALLLSALRLNALFSYSETSRHSGTQKNLDQGVMQKCDLTYQGNLFAWGEIKAGYQHELNLLRHTPERSFGLNFGFRRIGHGPEIGLNYAGHYKNSKFFSDLNSFDHLAAQNKYDHAGDLTLKLSPLKDLNVMLISNYSYQRFEYREDYTSAVGLLGRDNLTATFDYKVGASYPLFDRAFLEAEYLFRESNEEFGDLFSGQKIRLGELRLSSSAHLGSRDSIYLGGVFSVTAFMGKDRASIFSDRDKVYRLGQVTQIHRFSDYLLMRVSGSYQYNHGIYVSGELSANNNHNEIYLAQPELVWQPSRNIQLTQSWAMQANYIYYDYEKYGDSPRNTLYRKASYLAKADLDCFGNLTLRISYRYRYEDYGQLIYRDQWSQRISWDRKGHLPSVEFDWRPNRQLLVNPGYSYERVHSFDHLAGDLPEQTVLKEKELFKRQKIFININYQTSEKGNVKFSYERRIQKSLQFSNEDSDIFTLNIRRLF